MIKLSMIFYQGESGHSNVRPSGWSETWWNNIQMASAEAFGRGLVNRRADMLTSKASIIGFRVKDTTGPVQVFKYVMPGTITTNADIPQMSLACYTRTADEARIKYFRLRGLPDARTTDGQYVPLPAFQTAFDAFGSELHNSGWGWQGLTTTNPQVRITSIDANGNLVCAAGGTFAVGQTVIIRRLKNLAGKTMNGRFVILARTSDTVFQLANWIGGAVGTSGTVALYTPQLLLVGRDKTKFTDVTTQKVGRPPGLYRGRATKR